LKLPKIFAHRGANSFAPENTLTAFEKAIELGCDGIEFDVRYNCGERVLVFHDRHTYRMTGVKKHIQKITPQQIKELKIRQGNFPEEKIPTLEDVLDIIRDRTYIIIDIKKENFSRNGFEEKIITILNKFCLEENIIISSFNPFVLKKIAVINPNLHLGFIFRYRSSIMMLNGHPISSLHVRHRILSNTYLDFLKTRVASVFAWTIDKPEEMAQCIANNVDGIISNRPELFLDIKKRLSGGESFENID
jgi:glycerophosphoryl diester phosphodiesterase